jgi:hypothetical protein
MQLDQDQDRRQRVDPAEAPQPAYRFTIRVRLCNLRQPSVEFQEASLGMINWQQIIVVDDALRGLGPLEAVDPAPMRTRPIAATVVQASP